jgi:F-type H+-transporting ATPase subunit epsilon
VIVDGNITVEEEYESKFTKDAKGRTVLAITSGTIEMKENKVIVLAD